MHEWSSPGWFMGGCICYDENQWGIIIEKQLSGLWGLLNHAWGWGWGGAWRQSKNEKHKNLYIFMWKSVEILDYCLQFSSWTCPVHLLLNLLFQAVSTVMGSIVCQQCWISYLESIVCLAMNYSTLHEASRHWRYRQRNVASQATPKWQK